MSDAEDATPPALLQRAVERAVGLPLFMANLLAEWGEAEGLDWRQAAERLGCTEFTAARLALCHRPDVGPESFAEQVRRIAAFAEIDPDALANFVREADAIGRLRRARTAEADVGLLMAALDRLEQEGGSSEGGRS
jgi:hypothetical protein